MEHPHIVTICAWCPPDTTAAVKASAFRSGFVVSHGICPVCRERFFGVSSSKNGVARSGHAEAEADGLGVGRPLKSKGVCSSSAFAGAAANPVF